jgi:N-acetylglutamate synthase-like GNAT family acetyltransferase
MDSDMVDRIQIVRLYALPPGLEALRAEAVRQGFSFMDRLVSDWASGANTFSRPGECFFGASVDGRLVAVGGLNVDPYLMQTDVGRIRHVYVLDGWRRTGIGKALIDRLLSDARGVFGEVRLRVATDSTAGFYIRCGFSPADDATASHTLKFAG